MKSSVTQGGYSHQVARKKTGRKIAGLGLLFMLFSMFAGTQHFAYFQGQNRMPGGINVAGLRIYAPWQILEWAGDFRRATGHIAPFHESFIIMGAGFLMSFFMFGVGIRQIRGGNTDVSAVHGSAKWATREDMVSASLLPPKGKAGDGVYVGGWIDPKDGKQYYLRHNGKEHILTCAPSGSGKGVGLVITTLLSWMHSVVVLDIKGENWSLTSGWRKQQGHKVLRWDPTDDILGRSVTYNPLEEIRIGTSKETGDIMNLAGILVDPHGKGENDHWSDTARALLTGAIAHVIYKAKKEKRSGNLADVLIELTQPGNSYEDTMTEWQQYEHAGRGDVFYDTRGNPSNSKTHPLVAKAASEMLSRAENEASSVLSSTIKCLELYADPVIARNTAKSGFKLRDIMDYDRPVSLYLVLNPAEMSRIRPLIRMFLTQMIYALMPEMEFRGGEQKAPYKHRLLMLLDEFPAIGRMNIIKDGIAYFRGWNIKLYLIIQDLAQLYEAYGENNPIIGNCHIQNAYAPNKVETAKYLSEQTGIATVIIQQETESFSGTGMFANKSISRQQQIQQRPLLTPDECLRLPGAKKDANLNIIEPGDMLVFAAGFPAIYGKQILYFLDPTFSERAKINAPDESDVLI